MMDDAKIGGINSNNDSQKEQGSQPIFPDKIPSLLTTDDLVFEIGKHVIKCANAEKAVEKILEREKTFHKEAMEKITVLQKQIQEKDEFVKKAEEIRKSNQAYQEKNQALDKVLVDARREVSEVRVEMMQYQQKLVEAEASLQAEQEINSQLQQVIEKMKEKLDKLDKGKKKKPTKK